MPASDFINIGNPRKIKGILTGIIDQAALEAIESEIRKNTQQLFDLSLYHYRFAKTLGAPQWRQKISRFYYAGYSASKAVRYFSTGHHSAEGSDHKKVGDLPSDFPSMSTFGNKLIVLRDARNTCDYDHSSKASDLIISTAESFALIRDFLSETKSYLSSRGMPVKGNV